MSSLAFHAPTDLSSAAKGASQMGARFIAGGQSLLPAMRMGLSEVSHLIDLHQIPALTGIKISGTTVTIGAMSTHASVAESTDLGRLIPALTSLAGDIGDRQVRNRGTIGGSLANNDPAACYPAGVLGLGATIHTDKRKITADDFFKGLFTTALSTGEIITAVEFIVPEKAAYLKFKNPASRFSIVGIFVSKGKNGVRVAVTGAGSGGVFRVKAMEDALTKQWSPSAVDGIKVPASSLNSDLHASAEYRAHLIGVLTKRAVTACG